MSSLEDRALERLMEQDRDEQDPPLRMSDAEHRRIFGWGWDDPDASGGPDALPPLPPLRGDA